MHVKTNPIPGNPIRTVLNGIYVGAHGIVSMEQIKISCVIAVLHVLIFDRIPVLCVFHSQFVVYNLQGMHFTIHYICRNMKVCVVSLRLCIKFGMVFVRIIFIASNKIHIFNVRMCVYIRLMRKIVPTFAWIT